jgi:hypothetical protein
VAPDPTTGQFGRSAHPPKHAPLTSCFPYNCIP